MAGPLLKVTSTPFQSVRISQNARLVSSDSVDVERRKAIARAKAFHSQHSGGAGMDLKYVTQINQTFSMNPSSNATAPSAQMSRSGSRAASQETAPASSGTTSTISTGTGAVDAAAVSTGSEAAVSLSSPETQAAVSLETNSAYTMDRGAFEFRVAKGELAFLPPLNMTIITQKPEVHFEYTGGFHYVPASLFEDGALNLSI